MTELSSKELRLLSIVMATIPGYKDSPLVLTVHVGCLIRGLQEDAVTPHELSMNLERTMSYWPKVELLSA